MRIALRVAELGRASRDRQRARERDGGIELWRLFLGPVLESLGAFPADAGVGLSTASPRTLRVLWGFRFNLLR